MFIKCQATTSSLRHSLLLYIFVAHYSNGSYLSLRLGDSKSPQNSRTFRRILAELRITVFCSSTILVSIPISLSLWWRSLGIEWVINHWLYVGLEPRFSHQVASALTTMLHAHDRYNSCFNLPHRLYLNLKIFVFGKFVKLFYGNTSVCRNLHVNKKACFAFVVFNDYIWPISWIALSVFIGKSHSIVLLLLVLSLLLL